MPRETQITPITPAQVKKLVDDHEAGTTQMRDRMQTDYDVWYRLQWTDSRLVSKATGYQTYVSNEPRTYAKRLMSWLSAAKLIVRVPLDMLHEEERERANAKEQFIVGCLAQADLRLLGQMLPRLRDQLAMFTVIRGIYAGRALLIKKPDGTTGLDIAAFDPLHTFWATGPEGLQWMVHRQLRSAQEIEAEFGPSDITVRQNGHGEATLVYDWYDGINNGVCTENGWLKPLQPHYAPRIPTFIGVAGATPPILGKNTAMLDDVWEHFGESAFDDNREAYNSLNETMSDMKTLVRRSVRPPIEGKSRDGNLKLEGDPYVEGGYIPLREGDEVKALELLKMSLDTGPFLAQIVGEIQRGSIPHILYGEIPFQLSGYGMNTLGASGTLALLSRVVAMENAYLQIAQLLCEQYVTGGFMPLTLSGRTRNKTYFSRVIQPGDFDADQPLEITLRVQLPQDDMQKFAMAQIAREGPVPTLSDRTIRDDILEVQDVDGEEKLIREQAADRASPVAMLYGFITGALERGRPDLAQIYGEELAMLLQQRAQQVAGGGPGSPTRRPSAPEPAGARPEIMPNAMMGVPPPQPTPQAGPNVPPGSPRPGARGQPA